MDLSTTFIILTSFLIATSCFDVKSGTFYSDVDAALSGSMKRGESLKGHSVKDILTDEYRVAVAGGVENYTKWPLLMLKGEVKSGRVTIPQENIIPGFIEGFASRKTGWMATGTWVRYSLMLDDDIMVHYMYSAPFNFNYYKNKLAVSLCAIKSSLCQSMSAKKMYYNDFSFMERKEYYHSMEPVKVCYDNVCMMGSMHQTHQPTIRIRIYPKSFNDLSYAVRNGKLITPDEYDTFIKLVFKS